MLIDIHKASKAKVMVNPQFKLRSHALLLVCALIDQILLVVVGRPQLTWLYLFE